MDKETFIAAFVAAIMSLFLVSCEKSSYVGLDYSVEQNTTDIKSTSVPEEPEETEEELPEEQTSEEELSEEEIPEEETSEEELPEEQTSDEFEKVLPPEWGIIIGAGISAVPADDEKGCFDKKCLIVRTELGAVTIVFSREEVLPEVADIVNCNFVKGNFDETYNSAVFVENSWVPAQAVDSKDRLEYLIEGVAKRNLRYTTLKKWDWQNKDDYFSTKVSGYEINVEDGILNVNYGGEQVLKIR